MFGDDTRAAGRSNESVQYKQPPVRTSKTFQDSNIFGSKDATSSSAIGNFSKSNEATPHYKEPRISKTYQDSNIFGNKDVSSGTITADAKREMQRPFTAHKKVITMPTEINEVFTRDDKNARQRLRKTNDRAFEPSYEHASPTRNYVNEFYGPRYTEGFDGPLLRPKSAASKSFSGAPRTAADVKWKHQNSNIFCDDSKVEPTRQTPELGKLLSAKSQWSSKDTFQKSANLRKSVDLTSTSMAAFAQNKKRMEMHSDIFNVQPRREQKSVDPNARPRESAKAKFTDSSNQDVKKLNHMFSNILSHEDKNYSYNNVRDNQTESIRPTNLAWNDSRIEKMSPKKTEEGQTANERKMAHLTSSIGPATNTTTDFKSPTSQQAPKMTEKAIEKEMKVNMSPQEKRAHDMRSEVPFGQSSQSWATTKPEPSATYDFDLSSIPKNIDIDSLKKNFAGYHVIDLQAARNNVNGDPTGTGRVQIRASASHDLLKLKHDLKQQGIVLTSHQENHNKKSNYRDLAKINWHDQYLQNEEGRLKSDFATPLESKLRNLESEGDIFGNTHGVGKWDRSTLEKVPTSKTDNGGIQRAAEDVVKTLNWKNSIKKVATTAKSGASPEKAKPKYTPVRQSKQASMSQPKKTK